MAARGVTVSERKISSIAGTIGFALAIILLVWAIALSMVTDAVEGDLGELVSQHAPFVVIAGVVGFFAGWLSRTFWRGRS